MFNSVTEFMKVGVKSPLSSKINIAQIVSIVAMAAAMFGLEVPAEVQAEIVSTIVAINALVTIIARTWFTTSVTPQSAKKIS